MWVVPEIVPAVDRLVVSIIVPAVDDLIVPAIEKFIRRTCPTFHSTSFRETTHVFLRGGLVACFAIASRAYSAPSAVMSSVMFFLIFHKMEKYCGGWFGSSAISNIKRQNRHPYYYSYLFVSIVQINDFIHKFSCIRLMTTQNKFIVDSFFLVEHLIIGYLP